MPVIQMNLLEGRSVEQKRAIAGQTAAMRAAAAPATELAKEQR